MAGHSHWATIKHKKAKEDAKRGKSFTKLVKEITVAARVGGGDPAGNPRLRLLLDKARGINMPLENTQRAIKKGTGELPGQSYDEITYEGYGPGGIAVMVDALTDNKNRTVAELRRLFSSEGGVLAEPGAVGWMFERLGVIRVSGKTSEDNLLELLIDYDIRDISQSDSLFVISTDVRSLESVKQALTNAGLTVESAEIEWVAKDDLSVSEEQQKQAYEFLAAIEDHDDVQNIYTNMA